MHLIILGRAAAKARGIPGDEGMARQYVVVPGPSGQIFCNQTDGSPWRNYWNNYGGVINNYFSWLALHAYPTTPTNLDGLKNSVYCQATDLRYNLFKQLPRRRASVASMGKTSCRSPVK
jgi:hypothetical protein